MRWAGGDDLFWNCGVRRIVGCFLVFIGVVLMLCFMPFWLWIALIGIGLIALGCCLLFRKC